MTSKTYIPLSDPMYEKIENQVRVTYNNSCILWIEYVMNPILSDAFDNYVESMKAVGKQPNVLTLFHGTREGVARIIIEEGFNPSINRVCAHGLGTYFSTRAVYSKDYCVLEKGSQYAYMLVCDVAVGKSCRGKPNKPIDSGFDSATDSLYRPDMYIVNKREAALPKYLVCFMPNAN